MPWDVLEKKRADHTHTPRLPKSGVARKVCYHTLIVFSLWRIPKTCLPTNKSGEYLKQPFNLFSANGKKVPKKE